jgi:hypothetical protein
VKSGGGLMRLQDMDIVKEKLKFYIQGLKNLHEEDPTVTKVAALGITLGLLGILNCIVMIIRVS